MLPKNNRIKRVDFENIIRNGKRYNSPHLLLYVAKSEKPQIKFAFSVSKKICKNAVGRNKLRRQGYSSTKTIIKNIKPGFLFLFVYKKTLKIPDYRIIEKEVGSLLKEAFVLV